MGCVYRIKCLINNRIYIGSTSDINSRIINHKSSLRNKKHRNKYLQEDYNKYGEDCFEFEILEVVENDSDLLNIEQWYLNNTDCLIDKGGYNILIKAGSPEGVSIHTEDSRKSMSEKRKGENNPFFNKTHSNKYKNELSKRQSGESNVNAKLNWDDVNNIRKMILENAPMLEIIKKYNISEPTFYRIKSNRSWKDDSYVSPDDSCK